MANAVKHLKVKKNLVKQRRPECREISDDAKVLYIYMLERIKKSVVGKPSNNYRI